MDNATKRDPAAALAGYRKEIDAIDDELVRLLSTRSAVVSQVKTLKDTNWPSACHIRPGREGAMHAAMFARFKHTHLGAQAGAELWRLIISASTMIESKLKIATMPETATLAQCYFSPLAHYEDAADTRGVIHALSKKHAEIACIPSDTAMLATIIAKVPDARVFAYAPLVLKSGKTPQALFIGHVTPEASGDDVSYFLHAGNAITLPGYHETHPTIPAAQFIGAHATPLTRE